MDGIRRRVGRVDGHVESGDRVVGQQPDVVARVASVVDIQVVIATAPGNLEQRRDAVDISQRVGSQAPDVDRVGAEAGVDQGVAGDGLHVDSVATSEGVKGGLAGVRRVDRERVAAGAQVDVEELEAAVSDTGGSQAGKVRGREGAGVRGPVAGVARVHRVVVVLALHREVPVEEVQRPKVVRRRGGEREGGGDVDPVVPVAGLHSGVGGGPGDVEPGSRRPQLDCEELDARVVDADGHPEAGEMRRGEQASLVLGLAGLVDVEVIARRGFPAVDGQGAHDPVDVAAGVEGSDRRRRVATDLDRVVTAVAVDGDRPVHGQHVGPVGIVAAVHRQGAARVGGVDRDVVAVRVAVDLGRPGHSQHVDLVTTGSAVDRESAARGGRGDRDVVGVCVAVDLDRPTHGHDADPVGTAAAVDRQGAGRVGRFDRDVVGTRLAVDGERGPAGDGLHGDIVCLGPRVDRGRPRVGVRDGEGVAAGAQVDVEGLEAAVGDALGAHVESG